MAGASLFNAWTWYYTEALICCFHVAYGLYLEESFSCFFMFAVLCYIWLYIVVYLFCFLQLHVTWTLQIDSRCSHTTESAFYDFYIAYDLLLQNPVFVAFTLRVDCSM